MIETITAAQYRAAASVIAFEERWIRGDLALDAQDEPVAPTDPSAVRWCAVGALCKVLSIDIALTVFDEIVAETDLVAINDSKGREAALYELLRLANEAET